MRIFLFFLFLAGFVQSAGAASTPDAFIYQGRLLSSTGAAITTARTFRFSIWKSADWVSGDTTGAGAVNTSATNYGGWWEYQTITPNSNGVFSVELGSGSALPTVNFAEHKYLQVEVKVQGAADTSYELIDPTQDSGTDARDRMTMASLPYSKNSDALSNRILGSSSGNILYLGPNGVLTLTGGLVVGNGKAITASGAIRSQTGIVLNFKNEAKDVVLTFGNSVLPETLRFLSAEHRFEFSDDVHITNNLSASGSLTVDGTTILNSDGDTSNVRIASDNEPNLFFTHGTSDRVGIKTSTPETDLEIVGTASGNYLHAETRLTSSGTLRVNGATTIEGLTTIRNLLSGAFLHVSSGITASGSFVLDGTATFNQNLTFGDSISDAITIHAGTWTFLNDTNFVLSGGVNGLSFDTDTLSIDAQNNRIGIGTTAPESTLEVVGSVSGSSLVLSNLRNCDTIDTDASGVLSCGSDNASIGISQTSGDDRYINQSGDTMTGSLTLQNQLILSGTGGNTAAGALWRDSTQKALQTYTNGIEQTLQGVIFTQTGSKTVSNTTSDTTLLGSGVGTTTLPANFFTVGKTVRIKMSGSYSTPIGVPSATIKIKLGSTTLATITTTSLLSGASDKGFSGEIIITCRSTGASGTAMIDGFISYQGASSVRIFQDVNSAGSTPTIDTTAANALDVTLAWDAASSSRSATSFVTTVEILH